MIDSVTKDKTAAGSYSPEVSKPYATVNEEH